MKLDTLTLVNARIVSNVVTRKITEYEYLWCNENAVEESGLGIRRLVVEGWLETAADRDALEQACESAGIKKLYFESAVDVSPEDRYYKVQTLPAVLSPESASVYGYSFECLAADSAVYDAITDLAIF